jgi:cobalt-zinc-cadmium efflux system protein
MMRHGAPEPADGAFCGVAQERLEVARSGADRRRHRDDRSGYRHHATAVLFAARRRDDINIQGAFLHMAGDAAVSAGVIVSAALILWTGWLWLDTAMSLVICAAILWSTTGLLRSSIDMSMAAAPPGRECRCRAGLPAAATWRPDLGGYFSEAFW